jgi:ribosomal protein S18 acetylase RimI-like enzyme
MSSQNCQAGRVEIVPAQLADADALQTLHLLTWKATYRDHAAEPWYGEQLAAHGLRDWQEIVRTQAAHGGGMLIAREPDAIIGFSQYGPAEDDGSGVIGHIHRLYVHPARQRTGVGRSLLAASVERLRQNGARAAALWVLESDQRARAFYERMGWKPDGARSAEPTDLRYRLPLLRTARSER